MRWKWKASACSATRLYRAGRQRVQAFIYLIRHGQTALNAAAVVQPSDTPLNGRGVRQAQLLAPRMAELGVAHVVASDLPRAVMTAEPIVLATSAAAEYTALLQERNFGDVCGTPYAELSDDIFAPGYEPPNGESDEIFDRRVRDAWAYVLEVQRRLEGNLAVVTHGLVLRSLCFQSLQLRKGTEVPGPGVSTELCKWGCPIG
jgi:probable phosphoglycerate mutase